MTVNEVICRENDTQTIDGDSRMVFDENQKVSTYSYICNFKCSCTFKSFMSQRPITFCNI